jgi:rfaE bifunctional protein nucleotidyltransferase chain/domain
MELQTPKLFSVTEVVADVGNRKSRGQKVVFTNGCFDVIHAGHVYSLRQARALGDYLVVGLNSDASVRRLKGNGRPRHTEDKRAYVLAALECVDAVVIFGEETPEQLIEAVAPNVLVKGEDYRGRDIAGSRFVEANGGRIVLVRLLHGLSSTHLIEGE